MHTKLLAAALLCAFGSLAYAGNWARFRGPNGDGVAQGENIPIEFGAKSNILWKTPIPGDGNGSPVVWDKSIFLQSATKDGKQRLLICVDAASGSIRWQRSFPAITAKKHGLNTLASATPVTDGEGVYLPFWDGAAVHMAAYSFEGELLWSKNLGPWVSQHGTGASPILYKDKLLFFNDMDAQDADKKPVPRASTLLAFNKKTGDLVWETPREPYRACYSAPFLLERNGGTELVVTSTTSIAGYNPDTGKQVWTWDWGWKDTTVKFPLRTIANTLHLDGVLYACSGDGAGDRRMVALKLPQSGENSGVVWSNPKDFPYVPGPITRGEHIYFVNDKGMAGCYHAKSGKRVWFERLGGRLPCVAGHDRRQHLCAERPGRGARVRRGAEV